MNWHAIIASIVNHLPTFEKINPAFHMMLLLFLTMVALVHVLVCQIMENDNHTAPVGFKDANESRNNSDDDENVDSAEVRFCELHCKDIEHTHDQSLMLGKEEADGARGF